MELIRNSNNDNSMLRFTYYVRPECEAKKFRDMQDTYDENGISVFTNDFFTVYRDPNSREMNISLNEIGIWKFSFFSLKIFFFSFNITLFI